MMGGGGPMPGADAAGGSGMPMGGAPAAQVDEMKKKYEEELEQNRRAMEEI